MLPQNSTGANGEWKKQGLAQHGFPYSAREAHILLEVRKKFPDWWRQQVTELQLQENIDFVPWQGKKYNTRGRNGRQYNLTQKAYELICMRNKKQGQGAQLYVATKKEQVQMALIKNQTAMMEIMQKQMSIMSDGMQKMTLALESLAGTVNLLVQKQTLLEGRIEQKQTELVQLKKQSLRDLCNNIVSDEMWREFKGKATEEDWCNLRSYTYRKLYQYTGIKIPQKLPPGCKSKIEWLENEGKLMHYYTVLLKIFPQIKPNE